MDLRILCGLSGIFELVTHCCCLFSCIMYSINVLITEQQQNHTSPTATWQGYDEPTNSYKFFGFNLWAEVELHFQDFWLTISISASSLLQFDSLQNRTSANLLHFLQIKNCTLMQTRSSLPSLPPKTPPVQRLFGFALLRA